MKTGSVILISLGLVCSVSDLSARNIRDHESDGSYIQSVIGGEYGNSDSTYAPSLDDGASGVIFTAVEQPAEFPGGKSSLMNWISENIKYPEVAQQNDIQGRVIVKLVIDAEGNVVDATIVKGVHASLDHEALRLTKIMPKWQAAKNNSRNVASYITLPFTFRLP